MKNIFYLNIGQCVLSCDEMLSNEVYLRLLYHLHKGNTHCNISSLLCVLSFCLENFFQNCLQAAWLLKAVTCIDLTTLSGDDTPANTARLCYKAKHPIREDLLKAMGMENRGNVLHVNVLACNHHYHYRLSYTKVKCNTMFIDKNVR